ncbi:AGE family epimerase/isomerase [Solitalea canadensis]|uniref:Cellobiose 2-epimerase n=1 Tax=Solitalea canadensis (strain ATCC 29591 / DSM 3403 / JCM 21819 / LMG 8368 / NBRC 15130 / NCIMB 12057 / USAM 9D) TaxID=929556 RepID=H8KUR0_SOLCM|nr:AGE family epimerase/isomerase [Solitalea canadensis]AFD07544.1 N-acyl-D-glucosamine 2-epimerase [Solitalea canadensis DSM 3403]
MMVDAAKYQKELGRILSYWSTVAFDKTNDRFYGKIGNENQVDVFASLGSVLYSRILWSFCAGYKATQNEDYLQFADKAYEYLIDKFLDKEYGGVYWSLDSNGEPLDTKKQIYALSFAIYGLTEYYMVRKEEKALDVAIGLYMLIEQHSFDPVQLGYLEAFNSDWSSAGDLRLSAKDANEKKTMNTHLHILEAYTNLYRVWPESSVLKQIKQLIDVFINHIIHKETAHLQLFFDENWKSKSTIISYGHDIEASWLLLEAAEVTNDEELIAKIKEIAVQMANAAAKGLSGDGGLNYEFENGHLIEEKHWWVQAEALVGFYNAFQLTGDKVFLERFEKSWDFIEKYILDVDKGEWYWGVHSDYSLMQHEDKAGFWKCPYHNSRACIEIMRRIA